MKKKDYDIAKEFKEKLLRIYNIDEFRVFGSRARGKSTKYSDMDVYIQVESMNKEIEDTIHNIAWEVGFENQLHISPLIFSRFEVEKSPLRVSPILLNIMEEGIPI